MTLTASTPETRRRDDALVRELALSADYDLPAPVCGVCGTEARKYMRFGVGTVHALNICRPCLVAALEALDGTP